MTLHPARLWKKRLKALPRTDGASRVRCDITGNKKRDVASDSRRKPGVFGKLDHPTVNFILCFKMAFITCDVKLQIIQIELIRKNSASVFRKRLFFMFTLVFRECRRS